LKNSSTRSKDLFMSTENFLCCSWGALPPHLSTSSTALWKPLQCWLILGLHY